MLNNQTSRSGIPIILYIYSIDFAAGIVQTSYLQVYSLVMLAMNVDVYAAIKWPIWHRLEARNTLTIWTAILISMFVGSALFYITIPLIFDYEHDKAGAVGRWIASEISASSIFIYYLTFLHVCFPNESVVHSKQSRSQRGQDLAIAPPQISMSLHPYWFCPYCGRSLAMGQLPLKITIMLGC